MGLPFNLNRFGILKDKIVLPDILTQVDYLLLNGQPVTIGKNYIPVIDIENVAGLYNKVTKEVEYPTGGDEYEAHFVDANNVDYKVVAWLESSNSDQFINTLYVPTDTTGARIRASISAVASGNGVPMGCRTSANRFFYANLAKSTMKFGYGWNTYSSGKGTYTYGDFTRQSLNFKNERKYRIIDQNVSANISTTLNEIGYPIFLFGENSSGNRADKNTNRISNAQISEGSDIVRNYIATVRSDSVAGMYDATNKVFYTNNGTGTFTIPT